MASRLKTNPKPLFTIDGPVKAKAYLSEFKPFQVLRFLDPKKLRQIRKQSLEIGTVEAVGRSATLVADFEKGEVTRLRLEGCAGCEGKGKARLRNEKKLFLAVKEKLEAIRNGSLKSPLPISRQAEIDGDIRIPIWPFPPIVIIVEPGSDYFCIAILVGTGSVFCYFCIGLGGPVGNCF